jgi:hypothetical protein
VERLPPFLAHLLRSACCQMHCRGCTHHPSTSPTSPCTLTHSLAVEISTVLASTYEVDLGALLDGGEGEDGVLAGHFGAGRFAGGRWRWTSTEQVTRSVENDHAVHASHLARSESHPALVFLVVLQWAEAGTGVHGMCGSIGGLWAPRM